MLPSMKLVDLVEGHAEEIAEQWAKNVVKHHFTPYYHHCSPDEIVPRAMKFYRNFRAIFMEPKPIEAAESFFTKYAEGRFKEGVPLHEAIYALILMRRQLWLYAEFQAVFTTAMEKLQAMESLNRTILVFDYAVYFITKTYDDLMKKAAANTPPGK
ncbi:MAG: hypothetical protein M0009_08180 [Deltaproteobacteria bacterium]|nr:hypothetical protein [Deltaproteobacteria bacterium]